ncbi:hypothetical protein [Alteromonas sediminis]|uniref:hypothetical protein n=1 Tax=Alteromonas sediminis TaxID=2259342 RepID=UPI00140517BA|nr:hypothetical protein [Alteromonas sediminis]
MNKQKSPLQRIFENGKEKVAVSKNTRELLPIFAENDHKKIALLIAKWLEQDNQT